MKQIFVLITLLTFPMMQVCMEPKISKEDYRELKATIKLLEYCNSYGAPLGMPRKPKSYPRVFYTLIKRDGVSTGVEIFGGVPVREFRLMCEAPADRLIELTQK